MCNSSSGIIQKLKDDSAYKTVVATLHFLHDDDDEDEGQKTDEDEDEEDDGEDDDTEPLGSQENWTRLTKKQDNEVTEKGRELLDILLEPYTLSQVNNSLEQQMRRIIVKPKATDVPEIRIELATLAVMNNIPKFGMDALHKDKFKNAFAMTQKIAGLKKNFTDKEKIIADGLKCYTSYIGLTARPDGYEAFDDKKIGDQYFDLNNEVLKKNSDPVIAKVFLREMANGLENRYNIIHDAKPELRPKLTKGDSILGTRGIAPGDKVDQASNRVVKMMKDFPENDKIQYFGAKA